MPPSNSNLPPLLNTRYYTTINNHSLEHKQGKDDDDSHFSLSQLCNPWRARRTTGTATRVFRRRPSARPLRKEDLRILLSAFLGEAATTSRMRRQVLDTPVVNAPIVVPVEFRMTLGRSILWELNEVEAVAIAGLASSNLLHRHLMCSIWRTLT